MANGMRRLHLVCVWLMLAIECTVFSVVDVLDLVLCSFLRLVFHSSLYLVFYLASYLVLDLVLDFLPYVPIVVLYSSSRDRKKASLWNTGTCQEPDLETCEVSNNFPGIVPDSCLELSRFFRVRSGGILETSLFGRFLGRIGQNRCQIRIPRAKLGRGRHLGCHLS